MTQVQNNVMGIFFSPEFADSEFFFSVIIVINYYIVRVSLVICNIQTIF